MRCKQPGRGPTTREVVNRGSALWARCAKQPGAGTQALSVGGGLAEGWGPQDPKRPLAHPFLGACAPHVALRARLPLFCFRPPLPCPWAAALMNRLDALWHRWDAAVVVRACW